MKKIKENGRILTMTALYRRLVIFLPYGMIHFVVHGTCFCDAQKLTFK